MVAWGSKAPKPIPWAEIERRLLRAIEQEKKIGKAMPSDPASVGTYPHPPVDKKGGIAYTSADDGDILGFGEE
jgi:hypothetical protein